MTSFPCNSQNFSKMLFCSKDSTFFTYNFTTKVSDSIFPIYRNSVTPERDSIISKGGSIYILKKDSIKLLIKHYAENETYNSKFNVGYLYPDISNKGDKIICHDSYYKKLNRREVRRRINDGYIIEIDIKSNKTELIARLPSAEIIRDLKYSPDDSMIYFFAVFDNTKNIGHYIFNFDKRNIEHLPIQSSAKFIKWIK